MPTFLDLDLDDQRSRLLQAWMCSEPPATQSELNQPAGAHLHHLYRRAAEYDERALTVVCTGGTEMQFALQNVFTPTFSAGYEFVYFRGYATSIPTAAVAAVYSAECTELDTRVSLLSDVEPESASVESERVIAFRPIRPELRQAIHSANVRLSPDAIRFVARARGRRLRFEEEPETQSE